MGLALLEVTPDPTRGSHILELQHVGVCDLPELNPEADIGSRIGKCASHDASDSERCAASPRQHWSHGTADTGAARTNDE